VAIAGFIVLPGCALAPINSLVAHETRGSRKLFEADNLAREEGFPGTLAEFKAQQQMKHPI
jgi:hypothetical protein